MRKSLYYKWCMLKNLPYTLRFNFHYFKPRIAFHLPVVFYSPVKLRSMKGKVILPKNIRFSIISIGLPGNEMFAYNTPNIWNDQGGQIIFQGSFGTNSGASFVIRNNALLQIGNKSSFGQNLRILCSKEITIGKELLASWDITIMDTDSHYFKNTKTGMLSEYSKAITIGKHCFIGSTCTLLKGSYLPDGSVVAACSVVTKVLDRDNSLYGGSPARFIKSDIVYER